MSKQLIECVPNFSEGKDKNIIAMLAAVVSETAGCTVLNVDPGCTTNRTVLTFVGASDAVVNGAFNLVAKARELIDMRKHKGAHARMGAVDVCPFVPVANATMQDCVDCACKFGERVGKELGLPIYLYEEAAKADYRRALKDIRSGEYEGLAEKITKQEWVPDYGPATFVPTYGATVTGARFFLIAYNINILGTKEQSSRIAFNLRENGRGQDQPGRLKKVKGNGWFLDEYNLGQVTLNLDDYRVTGIHTVFEEARKDASEIGIAVAGSEMIGLVPLEAMMLAADYYIKKEGLFLVDERQKVRLVVERLGLSAISYFDPDKRIVEYMVLEDPTITEPLASLTVRQFAEAVGARSFAPGGGSVSALAASLGSALGLMVGWLSYGKRKFEDKDAIMRVNIPIVYNVMHSLLPLIDADTNAYNAFIEANRLPSNNENEEKKKEEAINAATKQAIEVPLSVMRTASAAWPAMKIIAEHGNIGSRSDIEVGAKSLELGIWGAQRNVAINICSVTDKEYCDRVILESDMLLLDAGKACQEVLSILQKRQG